MDTFDSAILSAPTPKDVPEPSESVIKAIARSLEKAHGDEECDGKNCSIGDALLSHVYLSFRIRSNIPHALAIQFARAVLIDVKAGRMPPEVAARVKNPDEIIKGIQGAKDFPEVLASLN